MKIVSKGGGDRKESKKDLDSGNPWRMMDGSGGDDFDVRGGGDFMN